MHPNPLWIPHQVTMNTNEQGPFLLIWFDSQNGWVIIANIKCGMILLVHSQTSTVQPLKFGMDK